MTSRNGADVPAAIRHLHDVYTIRQLAEALDVHPTTVYRWRNGTRSPNPGNFEALREEINMRYAQENARHNLTVTGAKLASAFAALETDAERARSEEIAAEMRARSQAAEAQRSPSAFGAVDPFLLAGAQPEPALPF